MYSHAHQLTHLGRDALMVLKNTPDASIDLLASAYTVASVGIFMYSHAHQLTHLGCQRIN
jgi:hypothetical protein